MSQWGQTRRFQRGQGYVDLMPTVGGPRVWDNLQGTDIIEELVVMRKVGSPTLTDAIVEDARTQFIGQKYTDWLNRMPDKEHHESLEMALKIIIDTWDSLAQQPDNPQPVMDKLKVAIDSAKFILGMK